MAGKRLPKITLPARPSQARHAGDDYGVRDEPDWTTIDWGEHLRSAQIEGRTVNYADIGSGESWRWTCRASASPRTPRGSPLCRDSGGSSRGSATGSTWAASRWSGTRW